MSDRRLRDLERRWQETGTKQDRKAYNRERVRAGLPPLPREVIRHYVDKNDHGLLGSDGRVDLPKREVNTRRVLSTCGNELWPRNLRHTHYPTFRKEIHYTEDADEVTCKLCLRTMAKEARGGKSVRTHYAPGSRYGRERGITPIPVCGRNDSDKFMETFSWTMREVNCPACKRHMQPGQRRSRRPRSHVYQAV